MTITTLLTVHTVDDAPDALRPMLSMAASMRSHLDILVIGKAPNLPSPVYMETTAIDWDRVYRRSIEETSERREVIEDLARRADVSVSVNAEIPVAGQVAGCVKRHAMYADVILVPRDGHRDAGTQRQVFNSLLFDASLPVLLMGPQQEPLEPTRRVLIGWQPVPQAARAVRGSLPFIAGARSVHLAVVNAEPDGEDAASAERMATFLARHDLSVAIDHLSERDEVAHILNRHADAIDADLVVMGAYGHSKFREWMLGGTTRFMLADQRRPLLLSH